MRKSLHSFVLAAFVFTLILPMGTIPTVHAQSIEFRTIDGTGNNVANPQFGAAHTQLLRNTTVSYGDGISTPAGATRPSARAVSNAASAQSGLVTNNRNLTDYIWQWGQFVDHDIDLTEAAEPAEAFDIPVPTGDAFFDPLSTGTQVIELNRSVFDPATGTTTPRQQLNGITSFIDASNVYGSDTTRANALRTFAGGKLATSAGDLLPFNTAGLPNAGGTSPTFFLAGDVRANEQVGLTAMHTLFVREHNRLADEIAAANPSFTDEEIYQRARRIVGAQMQVITYNEWLPALLGTHAPSATQSYNPGIDPGIANSFSTAAFRLGHSMISPTILRLNNSFGPIAQGNLALKDAFFRPDRIASEGGIDPLLLGLARQNMQEIDTLVIDDLRNFLFGPPGAGGFDLASLNMQRGRDHGLPGYNQMRRDVGLAARTSFSQITSNTAIASALETVYAGDIEAVDAWIGGLAEDHLAGSSAGELFTKIIADQFDRLKNGDRFWYETQLTGDELHQVKKTTLADIIRRNTSISSIQDNVFFLTDPVAAQADLSITKTAPLEVAPGGNISYTVTITNAGPSTATAVQVNDSIPAGLTFDATASSTHCTVQGSDVVCSGFDITSGQTKTLTLVFKTIATAACHSVFLNRVSVTSAVTDPNGVNNMSDFASTVVACGGTQPPTNGGDPTFSITKTDHKDTTVPNDILIYLIAVTNTSSVSATNQTVTDTMPASVTFISADNGGTANGQTVTWTGLDIGAGVTKYLQLTVRVNANATNNTVLTNTATIGTATATDNTTVQAGTPHHYNPYSHNPYNPYQHQNHNQNHDGGLHGGVALSITDTHDPLIVPCEEVIRYIITLHSRSDYSRSVNIVAELDNGMRLIHGTSSPEFRPHDNTVRWNNIYVPGRDHVELELEVAIDAPYLRAGDRYKLVVRSTYDTEREFTFTEERPDCDLHARGNIEPVGIVYEEEVVEIGQPGGLVTIDAEADRHEVQPGSLVHYTIDVHNQSNDIARDIAVDGRFTPGTMQVMQAGGGLPQPNGLTWNIPDLGPGESRALRFSARADETLPHGRTVHFSVDAIGAGFDRVAMQHVPLYVINQLPQTGETVAHDSESPSEYVRYAQSSSTTSQTPVGIWVTLVIAMIVTGVVGRRILLQGN